MLCEIGSNVRLPFAGKRPGLTSNLYSTVVSLVSPLTVQVGAWIVPITFSLAVGVAAKATLLVRASKETANKLF